MASSSNTTATSKKLILRSSDGEVFEVEEEVASLSVLIKNSIEDSDDCPDTVIPLPNVNARELVKVIEYCRKHSAAAASAAASESSSNVKEREELKKFDSELVKDYDFEELFSLVVASNYLNVPDLTGLLCQAIADRIKDKTPEEVREIFKVENDFTPEEEEKVRNENKWAFES